MIDNLQADDIAWWPADLTNYLLATLISYLHAYLYADFIVCWHANLIAYLYVNLIAYLRTNLIACLQTYLIAYWHTYLNANFFENAKLFAYYQGDLNQEYDVLVFWKITPGYNTTVIPATITWLCHICRWYNNLLTYMGTHN